MERINSLLQRAISRILLYEVKHEDLGNVSVTKVEVSKDLHYCKVFIFASGDREEKERVMGLLERIKPVVQYQLGKNIELKFIPKVRFYKDRGLERAFRIYELLDDISDEEDGEDK